jgi:hypothetical protein
MIGHIDKECAITLKKGEEVQFGKWLRWLPLKKRNIFEPRRGWSNGGGRRMSSWGSKLGSDGPSWRKEGQTSKESENGSQGKEREVRSPLKITDGCGSKGQGNASRELCLDEGGEGSGAVLTEGGIEKHTDGSAANAHESFDGSVIFEKEAVESGKSKDDHMGEAKGKKEAKDVTTDGRMKSGTTFKRRARVHNMGVQEETVKLGKRRTDDDMEVDVPKRTKKSKDDDAQGLQGANSNNVNDAGLLLQLREQK